MESITHDQCKWHRASKIQLEFETKKFVIKTISSQRELEGALQLRSEVFRVEYGIAARPHSIWDIDEFDANCDHLVLIEKECNRIVGTYRILNSKTNQEFYSQTEFEMDFLLTQKSGVTCLELGRACIDSHFRNGITLGLLWRGILLYSQKSEAEFLFGCTSCKTEDPLETAALIHHFQTQGCYDKHSLLFPTISYQMPKLTEARLFLDLNPSLMEQLAIERLVPPLMRLYLKAGAKIVSLPAYDKKFHCVDFLTVLEAKNLDTAFSRKFS